MVPNKVEKEHIEEIGKQISENHLKEGDYIILVYELHPRWRRVFLAYRNFQEFENKVADDIREENIDEDNSIYLEWRTFD